MKHHSGARIVGALLALPLAVSLIPLAATPAHAEDLDPVPKHADHIRSLPLDNQFHYMGDMYGSAEERAKMDVCYGNDWDGKGGGYHIESELKTRQEPPISRQQWALKNNTSDPADLTVTVSAATTHTFGVSFSGDQLGLLTFLKPFSIQYQHSVTNTTGASARYTVPVGYETVVHYGDRHRKHEGVIWQWRLRTGGDAVWCEAGRFDATIDEFQTTEFWNEEPRVWKDTLNNVGDERGHLVGENWKVHYTTTQPAAHNWVGVYAEGKTPGVDDSVAWAYAPGPSGVVTVPTSQLPEGLYSVCLYHDNGYKVLACT